MEPSSSAALEYSHYECDGLLVDLRRQKMVRPLGTAPSSPAWRAEILLLNDGRMAAGAATAAASSPLQGDGHLSIPSSEIKMARATSAALALIFRSTGGRPCRWTSHAN